MGPGAKGLSLKLVSTTELRVSPGRAELGLTLRLVNAVWGRGHSGRRAHKGGYTHKHTQMQTYAQHMHIHIHRIHTIKAGYKEDTDTQTEFYIGTGRGRWPTS